MFRPLRGNNEFTKVSAETEVKIPWQTFVRDCFVSSILILIAWVIGWLLWFSNAPSYFRFGRWLDRVWSAWFYDKRGWVWVVITLLLGVVGAAVAYLYRLKVEQVIKNPPQYTQWPAEKGAWHPWVNGHKRKLERAADRREFYRRYWEDEE